MIRALSALVGGWRLAVGGRAGTPDSLSTTSRPTTGKRQPATRIAILLVALALPAFAQTEVVHREDFQTYKTPSNPPGWVDTSVGNPHPSASGLFKAWNDPLQGNQGPNVVYGTKQSSGKPEGNNPRIGTFSTLTTKTFNAKGRFEYQGRLIRTNTDSRIGLTFLSSYPEQDKYYLLGLWSQPGTTRLTMQLFGFGAGTLQGTVDSNLVIDPNRWYRFSIQVDDVANTTRIRARFWIDGTTEPATYAIDATDAAPTRLTAGRIGMWAASKGDAYIDDLFAKSPVDHAPPVITFVDADTQRVLDPAQLALFKTPARVEIRVTDDLSTATYTAKLDGTNYISATPITVDGLHEITVDAIDAPGNTATASLDLLVDQVPPLITLHIDGAPFATGAIFNRDVTLSAVIQDISTVTSTATLNGAAVTLPQPIAEERVHAISVTAIDQVGWESVRASSFIVDKTAPVLTILANGVVLGGGESFRDDVTLTWSATDLTLDRIEATLNGAPISSGTTISAERIHDLVVTAYDRAAHSTTETRRFVLDKTAPEVRLVANGQTFIAGTTFNAAVTFTADVNDTTPTTEVATLDGQHYTLGTPYNVEGPHTIQTVVTNAAGLSTTVGPSPFTIDLTPPTITLTESGQPFTSGLKFNRDVNPVVTASDNLTSSPERELFLNGIPFPLDTPITEENADHVISAKATDAGGNSASVGPFHFLLDKTKPVVTIVEDASGQPFEPDALFARAVRVRVTVTDMTATTVAATLNGAPFDPSSPVTADGTYTVSVVATDEVGWQNDPVTASFTIDTTPPRLTFTSHTEGEVVTTPTVIVRGGSDDAITVVVTGVPATVDVTAKTFVSEPVALVEGTNTITATGTDKAGNIGTAQLRLELDTRAPEVVILTPAAGACVDVATLTVTGTVSDSRIATVKVNGVEATLTGGNWTATVPVSEGSQLLTIVATDTLAHSTTVTRNVLIDRTAPVLDVRESGAPFTGTLFNRVLSLLVRAVDADPDVQLTAVLDGAAYTSGTAITGEGAHTLEVTATDCAAHRTTRTFAFTIDRTPPAIRNLNPPNGGTVGVMPNAITGSTDPDAVTIELLGTGPAVTPAPDATFTLSGVAFAEGTNRFVLRATDRAGNSSQTDYVVTVKTAPPIVRILENGSPLVSGTIYSRVVTPEIKVNDSGATPTATLNATLNGAPYTSGTPVTADGDYRLIATATDTLNHIGTAETLFTIDRTVPTVRITFPLSGPVSADQIEVRGTATSAVVADVNGIPVALDPNGLFVLPTLNIELGTTRIIATARDRAGNVGVDEVEVVRDDTRPGIILTYPPDRSLTNRPTTEVLGRVLSPNPDGVVTIGTSTTPVDSLGAFRRSGYPLVEGDNTITASTKTGSPAINSASVVVTADFTPPALTILESDQPLNDGARFAQQAVLSLQASDNRGSVTVELTVDGAKAATLPHTVTATGGHVAVAVARDQAGNETRVERTFFVGATGGGSATCVLDNFDPAHGAVVLSASTTLLGRTSSEGVKVSDLAASVADGSFRATVELPLEGANIVTLRCTDAAGAVFGDAVAITLNRVTGDPSIEITTPTENFVTADETIIVTGTVGPGVVTADINGAPAVIAGSDPSVARPYTVAGVRLASGLNILVAHGKNAAGRVATASRRVFALRNQPAISISSPLSGTITGTPKIDLAGTYSNLDPATIVVTNLATNTNTSSQTTAASDTGGTFSAFEISLVSGEQTLRVTGRDQANRQATASVAVRLVAGAPSISITAPANNSYYGPAAGDSFTISGTFAAAAGATVDVAGTGATLDGATFTATASFSTIGANTSVVARVNEPGGASAVDTVVVTKLAAAPKVIESFPPPNAVEVDAGALLLVLFSAPMDRATLAAGAFRLDDSGGAPVSGTLFLDRDVLTFAPAALLTRGARYTLRVSTAAKDLAGTALESEWVAAFTVGTSAPATPPSIVPVSDAFCGQTVAIRGTAPAGARLQLASGALVLTTLADAQGNFSFDFPLSGQSGYAVVRVRVVGSDGSLSPAAELTFRVDCVGPQVLNATYDRGGPNRLTIDFSEAVDAASATTGGSGAIFLTLSDGRNIGGTATVSGQVVTLVPAEDLSARSFTLNVGTAIRDTVGNRLTIPSTQSFTTGGEQPPTGDGSGFISGEVYDATTGRPLAGASVTVEIPGAAFTTSSDARGRYLARLPEGAHTIRAAMGGYSSVWRQIVVPAGAGVVPIDIRLTRRGDTQTSTGAALSLAHGGETAITRPVALEIAAGVVAGGKAVSLTAIGAQSLTGLLPLGWSPLTAAEITVESAIPGAQLLFTVPAADISAASQNLAAVRYDEARDEWSVLASVTNVSPDGRVTVPIAQAGSYALVFADKAPGLPVPPLAQTGAVLVGVAAPEEPAALVSRSFTLDPPIVLPNGRAVATLEIEGAGSATFPSGTAVQAYIDEELRLADGSRLLDPPFATDLLLYRNLAGAIGTAGFHLAPSPRAAQVILEVGFDHIRVVPYPGRLDRGTLVGSEGGRIPGDDRIAIDIPDGATPEPLRATALSLTQQDLDAAGAIAGFQVLGGFTLTLQRATPPPPQDADGDGQADAEPTAVELFKPARATFTLNSQHSALSTQLILVELLDQTPYGRMVRLAAQIERLSPIRATTTSIDRSILPLDGVAREGRYLLLAADAPIAFATGVLRLAGNTLLAGARITAGNLGVAELTRIDGMYNIPVPATPAAPFSLTPRHTETGNGAVYVHASSPAPDAVVRVDLALVPQPPSLVSVTVLAGQPPALVALGASAVTNVSLSTGVRATFSPAIDPSSVNDTSITVVDASTGIAVGGKSTADGTIAVQWTLTPGTTLESGRRYTVLVSPRIRAANGAELGVVTSFGIVTSVVVTNAEVRAELISITIPDENGVSRVTGGAGALPANWQALVVRRRRDFITRYQATATPDGSFTFLVGNGGEHSDRVTMGDLIDLRVVNNAGNLAAIIPLTPFVTADRRGFVVPAGEAVRFVTADNIVVDVPAGTFDEATIVTANVAAKAVFDDVPSLDHDVNFAASVRLDFEGRANQPIEIEIPVPAGMDTTNRDFILALKGQSIRGPRLMAVDTIRIAGGKFTTTPDPSPGARRVSVQSQTGGVTANETLTGNDLKDYLMRVERSGVYIVLDIRVPVGGAVGWAAMSGIQASYDIFWNVMASFYAAHYYVVERGRIAIPVLQGQPFTVVGVDASTGLQAFTKAYDPLPIGDPGVSTLPSPQNNQGGPHPVFATPFRVDVIDLAAANVNIRTARNFVIRLANDQVTVVPSDEPLPSETLVEMLNVSNGQHVSGTAAGGLSLAAKRGHRIVLLVEEREVDPNTPITVVFNEPIFIEGTDEDTIHEFLKTRIALRKATLPPDASTWPDFSDITDMARFTADSGGRRVTITLPSSLQREAIYRVVLDASIADRGGPDNTAGLTLGQGADANGNAVGGSGDLQLDLRVRKPGGTIGSFELQEGGAARDLALNGNVLFVAASLGGLVAYDVADPASLNGVPEPIAVAPANGSEAWALASDHHGRIYTTNLGPVAGQLRSYRLEDFTDGGTCCRMIGSALTNWRVGYSSNLGLVSNTFLSDRPESFPRKIQLALQDLDTPYQGRQAFIDGTGASIVANYSNDMATLQASFDTSADNPYRLQRITVENQTLDMRWSADASAGQPAVIENILAGPTDRLRVIRNRTTYGIISHLGYGVGMYDLNAIESNRVPNPPTGYRMMAEQVSLTRGKNVPSCFPSGIVPPAPAIQEIWLSADTALRPEPGTTNILAYAPEPYRGLLDLRFKPPSAAGAGTSINNSSACDERGRHGLIVRGVDPEDDHPRVKALKAAYTAASGRQPYPHFLSVANYTWRLEAADNKKGVRRSVANQTVQRDYVLLASGDLGLLVVEVGGDPSPTPEFPYWPLEPIHLADIIWVPGGALAVRTVPRTNLAVVVSRFGRVHLVDLSRIDERFGPTGAAISSDELFPTAKAAIAGVAQNPEDVGAPDPRIVWTSEPNTALGVLAPVVDPDTGMMYAGHVVRKIMKAVAAIDPRVQMKVDLGQEALSEVSGIVPHGIDPPQRILDDINNLPPCNGETPRCKENASLGTFRLEVSLPGSIAQLLTESNNELQVAVESERVFSGITEQTPPGFPRSHLRRFRRDGSPEDPDRAATSFRLRRLIPEDAALEEALRYQKGFNKFVSPWIVAIADPRASSKYLWPSNTTADEKAEAGCRFCNRPQYLQSLSEDDGVYELWTNGRIIAVRPEIVANGNNIFEDTPYAYLGEENRLVTRFVTVMADTVRANDVRVAGQNPPVADGAVQDTIYLHSGEVQTGTLDLDAGGRAGFDVIFDRTYRSRTLGGSVLGQGWESSNFRRLRVLPNGDVELRDSSGEIWLFTVNQDGTYQSPKGFFMKLLRIDRGWMLLDQKWRATAFDDIGRLMFETDEFADDIAVAAGTNKGNVIRYLYDHTGRLAQIVDPVERASDLTYWKESEAAQTGAFPGLLKEVKDWRLRSVLYEYDELGRLSIVKTPEVKAADGVPSDFNFTGGNRPRIEYGYPSVPLPPSAATPSQDFNDYLEFVGNLRTIKEPDQVAASGGTPRVTLEYGTSGQPRDRMTTQTWGTDETVTFTHSSPTAVSSVDAYGQRREYTLTSIDAHDGRPHLAEGLIADVAVIETSSISGAADVNLSHSSSDLTASFTYNDEGLHETIEYANGLRVENTWRYAKDPSSTGERDPSIAPGMVLEKAVTTGPNLPAPVQTVLKYDKSSPTALATQTAVGRGDGSDVDYRDDQSPSRDRETVTAQEEGFTTETTYNDAGLPSRLTKKDGGTVKQEVTTDYYDPDATPLLSRSRTKKIASGSDISQSFTYSDLPSGGEKILITDDHRGVNTETHLDTHGRKTFIQVTDANGTVLTKESFGYDAAGRLAYFSRQQTGLGNVETRITYDAMGRETSTSTTQAIVEGSPATLTTNTDYDMAGRKTTETGPSAGSGGVRTVTTVDGLGRPRLTERIGSSGELVRTITGFDRSGSASYQSDGVRSAMLILNDARGRETGSVTADGSRSETVWGPWDEPLELIQRGDDGAIIGNTRNFFTEFGRLRSTNEAVDSGGRARATYFTWNAGDTERGTRVGPVASISTAAPSGAMRVQQQYFNEAGRLTREIFGAGSGTDGAPSATALFGESEYHYTAGGVPSSVTIREPRAGASSTTTTVFDGLERPVESTVEGAGDSTRMTYDEAGNVLAIDAPGMDSSSATFDGRGLLTSNTRPGGGTIALTYDALGATRSYRDEGGATTSYTNDGLGRPVRADYPDGTSEETRYETGSGSIIAKRDRGGQWLSFSYSPGGRLDSVHIGETPSGPKLTQYLYDSAGRVSTVRNKDAGIGYDGYDLLGRPTITRTYRYANGSGLTESPVVLDVHTQTHAWSVFGSERESWRMPAAGESPSGDNPASQWLQTITETRDAGSNLTQQRSASTLLTSGEGRALQKLSARQRSAGPTLLETQYAYTGDSGTVGTRSFLIASASSKVGSTPVGGSVNERDSADRVTRTRDLGLSNRVSEWLYDTRGRLERAWLDGTSAAAGTPIADTLTPGDFRQARTLPPVLSPQQHQVLGASASTIEALSWSATENAAHQLATRDSTLDGQVVDARVYTFTGGRRTRDGAWTSEFDEIGRLAAITNTVTGRRLEYHWDPNNRLVGRSALRATTGGGWTLEDRAPVIASDGLPPRATFVWDSLMDRLVAIFEEGRSTSAAGPEAGLLRQYLHGDQGYDDPVRVVAADANGIIRTYLPLIDEAGTGSLQSVIDAATGDIAERVLYADAYGDGPRYLQGAVVDSIDLEAKKNANGDIEKVTVRVHFTEAIDPASLEDGVRLGAIDAQNVMVYQTTSTPELQDEYTIRWELESAHWASMSAAGVALEIAVLDTLRATRWGSTPVSNAPPWAAEVYGVHSAPDAPVIARQSFGLISGFVGAIPAGQAKTSNVYGMADLYLAASTISKTNLFTGFKAAPFIEPATSLVYLRARWYDPATGTFLTPDPSGYKDSSNLYAGFGQDPVNNTDPTGKVVESLWDAASLGMGVYSISQWDENTSFWEKALDVVGVGLDGAALALPFIPGGVGAALKAYRGVNTAWDATNAMRKAKKALDVAQAVEQAASAVQAGVRVYEDYVNGELSASNIFDVVQMGIGIRKAAKASMPKKAPSASAAPSGPCPLRLIPSCVAAGTPIATPDGASTPIENLRVGDRVAATQFNAPDAESEMELDSRDWHLVKLRMSNPNDPEDSFEIESLRPLAWIVEHEAYPGRTITFATERHPNDRAEVLALERMPEIAKGPGRVVLSTFTHRDQILTLTFKDEADPLDTTPSHRVFSIDRADWVPASELIVGDRVRTRDGAATIAAIEQTESARVFDIEVEIDHSYFADGAGVLAHNCGSSMPTILPSSQMRTIELKKGWRRTTFNNPQEDIIYILKDLDTNQLLKVGKTTAGKFPGRWSPYAAAQKHTSRRLGLDVFTISKGTNYTAEAVEKQVREHMTQTLGYKLPWDNTGGRLGKGPGVPGVRGDKQWSEAGWKWVGEVFTPPPGVTQP